MKAARGFLALVPALLAVPAGCAETARNGAPSEAEARLRAVVDSLIPTLEQISGLEARNAVNVGLRSPEQVRAFVDARLDEDFPPDELDGVHAAYSLLGLIPDTLDLRRLLADLYAEQIVGYYDPDSTMLYVVEGVPPQAARPVLVHELVHALQDQVIDLDSLIARERGNDRQLAAQAMIEGHATLVMMAFLAGEASGRVVDPATLPDPAEQIRAGLASGDAFPVFGSAPQLLREVLIFPYSRGASFAWQVWANRAEGERPPIGSLIPESTEQVLEPRAKFLELRDMPTDVAFADDGAGWRVVYENSLGSLETGLFLEIRGVSGGGAVGWDGDRYRVLEDDAGRRALVWYSVWDSTEDARAFARDAARALGAGAIVTELEAEARAVRIIVPESGLDASQVVFPEIQVEG